MATRPKGYVIEAMVKSKGRRLIVSRAKTRREALRSAKGIEAMPSMYLRGSAKIRPVYDAQEWEQIRRMR
jgi:hypothetical protein